MLSRDRELLARLSAINKSLGSVNQNMGELALRMLDTWQSSAKLDSTDLRTVGGGLVALANQLVHLGMDMAQRAVELEQIGVEGDDIKDDGNSGNDRADIELRLE